MIVLGLILAIAGALLDVGIILTIGVILIVVGVIFWILGALDRPARRRHRATGRPSLLRPRPSDRRALTKGNRRAWGRAAVQISAFTSQ